MHACDLELSKPRLHSCTCAARTRGPNGQQGSVLYTRLCMAALPPLLLQHILSSGSAGLPGVCPTSPQLWPGAHVWLPCCDSDYNCLQAGLVKVPGLSSPLVTSTILYFLA